MPRELKIHLLRPTENNILSLSMCGKITENNTSDPELITCKSCSGMYRTNVEWYSQVKNKNMVARAETGEGDLYTRQDLEAGLSRLGWTESMILIVLDDTKLFRNVPLPGEMTSASAWQQTLMGVRTGNHIRGDRR